MMLELAPSFVALFAALLAGIGLGFVYFGGLWLTVTRLQEVRHPGLLFAASFALRTAVVIGAMYLIGAGHWLRIVACLAGFIVMRCVLARRWGPSSRPDSTPLMT